MTSFAFNLSPPNSPKLVLSLKNCHKIPYFGRQWNVSTFCILADRGRPGHFNQENRHGLNRIFGYFPTLHGSRHDNEACWLLDVGSMTNLPDAVILSHKTKGSEIPQQGDTGRVELVVWGFGECFTGQNRTGQGVMPTASGEDRLLQSVTNNFSLTKYQYQILFGFQKSLNTEYWLLFGVQKIRILNTEYCLVSRKSEYQIRIVLFGLTILKPNTK